MADIAGAIILGCALLGLFLWYLRTSVQQNQPPTPPLGQDPKPGGAAVPQAMPKDSSDPSVTTSSKGQGSSKVADNYRDDDEFEDDITLVTLIPTAEMMRTPPRPKDGPSYGDDDEIDEEEDDDFDTAADQPRAIPIIYDDDAAVDEPTNASPLILVSAVGQTDRGQRRRKNEDCYLCLEEHHLFAVADGMGGHAGGEVASRLAVDTLAGVFKSGEFPSTPYPDVPRRGSELAVAIQEANAMVFSKAHAERELAGMGTTIVCARFSPNKQRLYVGHVGDSRCYRLRSGELTQLTTDHTMGAEGISGPMASHLSRAIGVAPVVKVDLIVARPRPGDVYLLCSDGLSKMASDAAIHDILLEEPDPETASKALIDKANEGGGRDNITVVLVRVSDPKDFAHVLKKRDVSIDDAN